MRAARLRSSRAAPRHTRRCRGGSRRAPRAAALCARGMSAPARLPPPDSARRPPRCDLRESISRRSSARFRGSDEPEPRLEIQREPARRAHLRCGVVEGNGRSPPQAALRPPATQLRSREPLGSAGETGKVAPEPSHGAPRPALATGPRGVSTPRTTCRDGTDRLDMEPSPPCPRSSYSTSTELSSPTAARHTPPCSPRWSGPGARGA